MDMLSMVSSAMGEEEQAPARRPGLLSTDSPTPSETTADSPPPSGAHPGGEPANDTQDASPFMLASSSSPFVAPARASIFAAPTTSSIFAAPTTSSAFSAPTKPSVFAAPGEDQEAQEKASSLQPQTPDMSSSGGVGRLSMRPAIVPQPELHFSTVGSTEEADSSPAGLLGMLGVNRLPAPQEAEKQTESQAEATGNVLEDFGASSIFSGFLSPSAARPQHSRTLTPGEKIQSMQTVSISSLGVNDYFDTSFEPAATPLLSQADGALSLAGDEAVSEGAREEDNEQAQWSDEEEFSDSDLEDAVEEAAAELSAFTGLSECDIVGEQEWFRLLELQSWQQEVAWLLGTELSSLMATLREEVRLLRSHLAGMNETVSFKSSAVNMGSVKEPAWVSRLHGHVSVKACAVSEAEVDVKLSRDGKKHGIHFASKIAQGEHNYFTLPQLQDAGNFLDLCASQCEDLQARQKEFSAYFRCEHVDGRSCQINDPLHHRTNHSNPLALSTDRRLLEESNSIRSHILADVTRAVTNISLLLLRAQERLVKQSEIRFPDTIVGIGGKGEKGAARFAESKAPQYAYFRPRPPPELCVDIGIRDGLLVLTALTLQVSVSRGKHKSKGLVGYSYKVDNLWVEVVDCEKVSCELKVLPSIIRSLAGLYSLCAEFRGKVAALEA